MKKLAIISSVIFMLASCTTKQSTENLPEIDRKVQELLSKMTIEEKAGQMTQITMDVIAVDGYDGQRVEPVEIDSLALDSALRLYKVGSILNTVNNRARSAQWWNNTISGIQKIAMDEIGIPILYGIDAIHGVTYTAGSTLFPQQIGQGATFSPDLVKKLNELMAYELRASNIPWSFSPVMDMGRDPQVPRFWETYGEDVYLAQQLGAAAVIGMEGTDEIIGPNNIASCPKHFLGYSSNSGKDRNPYRLSVRELKEIHASSFQSAIDAGARTIMISSGLINGYPVHANPYILTQLLRNEMGFDGMIVTDWADIENFVRRDKIAHTHKEAVKLAINAGIDMSMVPYNFRFTEYVIELANEGEIPMSRIDDAVSRILKLKFELGLMENPNTYVEDYPLFGSEEFESLALEAALESITLLKNKDAILPISKDSKVLVTGPNSNTMRAMNGGWSYSWQGEKVHEFTEGYNTFLEAIQNKIGKKNVTHIEGVSYNNEGKYYEEKDINIRAAVKAAKKADYILLFLGENSYCEKPGDLHDLYISDNQTELALALAKTGKPVILILNEGRPRLISKFEQKMDAVIQTYLPSNFGGDALAEILFGDYNPGGKLPYTYPMFPNSLITYDYKPSEKQEKLEGMYNYESEVAIQYEFGFGLSYTTFSFSNFKVSSDILTPDGEISVKVDVKNTGSRSGSEVAMLFTSDKVASISPDNKRLRRFDKVYLDPGESTTIEFKLTSKDLAFYNYENQLVSEEGEFVISIDKFKQTITLTETVAFDKPSKVVL